MKASTIISEINNVFDDDGWAPNDDDTILLSGLTKRSLETVTHLTEYEDQKAQRILATIAFLSALAGVIYNIFSPRDIEGNLLFWSRDLTNAFNVCNIFFHLLFYLYCLCVCVGVIFSIHAIRPRFNIPKEAKATKPKSYIFAPLIVDTPPGYWAKSFTSNTVKDIQKEYIKSDIIETYLIANKINNKLSFLKPGILLIFIASIVLFVWILWTPIMLYGNSKCQIIGKNNMVLVTDADNTLWDTNAMYAYAQISLYKRISKKLKLSTSKEPLSFVREIDQAIAQKHPKGLRYPPKLLVNGIIKALININQEDISKYINIINVDNESALYLIGITEPIPDLRSGVTEGLSLLKDMGVKIIVATEGSEEGCLMRLNHYRLSRYINRVIVVKKSVEFFRELKSSIVKSDEAIFCVGDQLDRDIEYAQRAGYKTIYFPGGFTPKWSPNELHVNPDYTVSSFADVPRKIKNYKKASI